MKLWHVTMAAVALTIGASAAQAGTKIMASPPMSNNVPVLAILYCDIVNLDVVPRDITIEIMDNNGAVVAGPAAFPALAPGQAFAYPETTGIGSWCRFSVDGSTKKFRALAVYDNGTDYTVSIPAY